METEKKQEPKKSPRFIHFGWYGQTMHHGKKKHNGVLTVAYRRTDSALKVGFVFCSPSDNFARKDGREVALRHMRNYPIVMPIDGCKNNRELILELVNYLSGIGPKGSGWEILYGAVKNGSSNSDKITSRIPGWAKKWWLGIIVNGKPMGRHQSPMKYEEAGDSWESVKYVGNKEQQMQHINIFDMPMGKFFKQAQEAGIAVDIMLG